MSLKGFPPEIHLIIKSLIPATDLRTHVCLYLSSPDCAALYDSEADPDLFWQRACWECGIGRLPDEDSEMLNWKDVAINSILQDGFCSHPQCGESLLEYNSMSFISCHSMLQ